MMRRNWLSFDTDFHYLFFIIDERYLQYATIYSMKYEFRAKLYVKISILFEKVGWIFFQP